MTGRRRLPWILATPLMVAGSLAAHAIGASLGSSASAKVTEADEHVELAGRLAHPSATSLSLIAGVAIAIVLVAAGANVFGRIRPLTRAARTGAPPIAFFLLPPIAYTLQEVAERLMHAERLGSFAHDAAFLPALALQLPFGVVAFLVARAFIVVARVIARALSRGEPPPLRLISSPHVPILTADVPRIPVLALGHAVRGPPLLSALV